MTTSPVSPENTLLFNTFTRIAETNPALKTFIYNLGGRQTISTGKEFALIILNDAICFSEFRSEINEDHDDDEVTISYWTDLSCHATLYEKEKGFILEREDGTTDILLKKEDVLSDFLIRQEIVKKDVSIIYSIPMEIDDWTETVDDFCNESSVETLKSIMMSDNPISLFLELQSQFVFQESKKIGLNGQSLS